METEGPWRAFTRLFSNSWNEPRRHSGHSQFGHPVVFESQGPSSWGSLGPTFSTVFFATEEVPRTNMNVSRQICNVDIKGG